MSKITILTPEQLAERDRRAQQPPSQRATEQASSPPTPPAGFFARTYPNITLFVADFGWIEIGNDEGPLGFIRAIDVGGLVWEGKESYPSLDAAFEDLEQGVAAWLDEEIAD